ncbi:hypothetical protein HQ45_05685 [Porphyromonas crevioricanis]|uniref:Internalin-J n=2 Tax=Porphyromonas crevioricanis TaxID=393921 RepID=A0A0A2FJP8_9PORP|nr:leucine-rich repeat domain-containing protein [Porphyromonas crevioricanis]KGN90275.1 hypothetical protein HQ45_05685 [Porphyromonas crevioricanis]KGN96375.1 hypothetical protein HQ38_01950 [Porphyromonas crevioricanis]SJZ96013.1 hypothetical protein SAMN02745203_01414 [Porphyromonas crevioricanis]SQH72711.1 Internalin-J precursor [Porphyromonas crevioricanis]GAD05820.1 hypothetical protein PORCRE_1529 [Porphyromonas crevioricanis JCM 15906]
MKKISLRSLGVIFIALFAALSFSQVHAENYISFKTKKQPGEGVFVRLYIIATGKVEFEGIDGSSFVNKKFCNYTLNSQEVKIKGDISWFYCYENDITELDVSNCPNLSVLLCYKNEIEKLDVTANENLESLRCHKNKIKELDLSKSSSLKNLECSNNPIEKVDVSQCLNLREIDCHATKVRTIDFSNNTHVRDVRVFLNEIPEYEMLHLVRTLPMRKYDQLKGKEGKFYVVESRDKLNREEKNVCNTDAVKIAGDKNWLVLDYSNGKNQGKGVIYPGVKPSDIELAEDANYAVYPNPAQDYVIVATYPFAEVRLLAMNAECLLTTVADSDGLARLNLAKVSDGHYVIISGDKVFKLTVAH